jgi:hypothetical protein
MECWSDTEAVLLVAFVEMVRRRTSARKKRTAYAPLGAAPARRGGGWVVVVLGALVVVNLYVFVWDGKTGVRALKEQAEAHSATLAVPNAPIAPVGPGLSPAAMSGATATGSAVTPAPGATQAPALDKSACVGPRIIADGRCRDAIGNDASAPPPRTIEGKVGKSDTLGRLLKHSGLSAAETDEIIRALSGALDFRTIRAGESFRIERGGDGRVMRFELELGKGRRVRAERQTSGELQPITDAT